MRARVNKDVCIGCSACVDVCPAIFSMDEDGKAIAIVGDIDENLYYSTEEARDACPVSAIETID